MLDRKEYDAAINRVVMPDINDYVHALVGLCHCHPVEHSTINDYFCGGPILVTRWQVGYMEGCMRALINVLNYRIESYSPCPNMLVDIARTIANASYDWQSVYNVNTRDNMKELGKLVPPMVSATTVDSLALFMLDLLNSDVLSSKLNNVCIILFTEAVLLANFDMIWDITKINTSELRRALVNGVMGDTEPLYDIYNKNLVLLTEE